MDVTVTIDNSVASDRIKAIGVALNVTGTDQELRGHLHAHLKEVTKSLYLRGAETQRENAERQASEDAAESDFTSS